MCTNKNNYMPKLVMVAILIDALDELRTEIVLREKHYLLLNKVCYGATLMAERGPFGDRVWCWTKYVVVKP